MAASGLQKNSIGNLRNFRLWLAIAGSFLVGALPASANLFQELPNVNGRQDRVVFSWQNSGHPSLADEALISGEVPSNGYYAGDFEDSTGSVFNSSSTASALAFTDSLTDINLKNYQSMILSGGPGETVTLDLKNFTLRDHATLTLAGTATTSFIINVTRQFSLSGMSKIVLSGGVQWNNVFFNVLGSGSRVSLGGRATLTGTLTASQRIVRLRKRSIVYGSVVASRVLLSATAQIILPPVTSP